MSLTTQIAQMANMLEDTEKLLIVEIMKRFLPDHIATPEDMEDITKAGQELENGETVSFNDIDWS